MFRSLMWIVVYLVCLCAFSIEAEYTDGTYISLRGWYK
jgi:hypothetical protein